MTIDWNGELEVVERDGSVHPATLTGRDEVYGGGYACVTWREGARNHWFERDGISNVGAPDVVRNAVEENKEDGMTKLKVGDRVRQVRDSYWRGVEGVYDGKGSDDFGYVYEYFKPDAGSVYSDGCPLKYGPDSRCGMDEGSFELITPATDELAELRAWKDAAIAKHPDLAEPETDEQAAERMHAESFQGVGMQPRELIMQGIKWARANPR